MKKVKVILLIVGIGLIVGITAYMFVPRFDTNESNKAIEQTKTAIKEEKKKNTAVKDYVAKISVESKIKDIYVFDNASEETLFNKGAGIEEKISSNFDEKDFTFVKGHVETTFKDLHKLEVGDVIKVTLKSGEQLNYKVTNIREEKYGDNNNIYTYTSDVGLSMATCSLNSINKQFPEKVLVVDSTLII